MKFKTHGVEKRISEQFKRCRGCPLDSAATATILCALIVIGWPNALALTAIGTEDSNTLAFTVFTETLNRTKVNFKNARLGLVNHFPAIAARYVTPVPGFAATVLGGVTRCASKGAIIALAVLYKVFALLKFPATKVAIDSNAGILLRILAATSEPPALPRTVHLYPTALMVTLKLFTTELANKCFYDTRSLANRRVLTRAATIFRCPASLKVPLEFFAAMLTSK